MIDEDCGQCRETICFPGRNPSQVVSSLFARNSIQNSLAEQEQYMRLTHPVVRNLLFSVQLLAALGLVWYFGIFS